MSHWYPGPQSAPFTGLVEVEAALQDAPRHGSCNARDASQICWAFATSGRHVEGLRILEGLAGEQGEMLERYSDHDMATTIWAVATMSCPGPAGTVFLQKLADVVCEVDFAPQGLSMTLWGYATLASSVHLPMAKLLEKLLPKVVAAGGDLAPQGASNILWALATIDLYMSKEAAATSVMG